MSYNPAFVADESPMVSSTGQDDNSNGIKLTSFKALPNQNVVLELGQSPAERLSSKARLKSATSTKQSQPAQQQQQQQVAKAANKKSTSSNLCMSTSSSLSLIDNPTLSSLTPSASSYSTTGSSASIESNSSGLCAAVECRDLRYDVGRGNNLKTILYNINVTIPEGSIYGLLGPSGCGKTTMLRCVVGRIKPKEGQVRVFGYKPNESGSQIPGPAIGYMPQVSTCNRSI